MVPSKLENAEALLQQLTERLPPTVVGRHALVLIDGKLKLSLSMPDLTRKAVNFDEGDFDKSIEALVDEVIIAVTAAV